MQAKISVDCGKVTGKVHPHIYGHFIEHLGRCIYGGIWAEMLTNRKFFSLYCDPPHRWADSREEGVVDPWFSIGRNENTYFTHDNTVFYGGGQSQRIDIKKADGLEHGIGQAGLAVQKDREYVGRLVTACQRVSDGVRTPMDIGASDSVSTCQCKGNKKAKGKMQSVKCKISLRDKENQVLDGKEIRIKQGEWETYKFSLKPNADCEDACLCLTMTNAGAVPGSLPCILWFGAVSLMPADNIKGMRRDTLELIKQIKPPIIRWPGGNFASGYHWKDGIGDPDKRPTRWDYAWNALEYNDFGTDEYLQFCKEVKCDPLVCINAGNLGTIKEATGWVEYCRGKVKYWDIGNEQYGTWQLGHMDAESFARKSLQFIKSMRKIDPGIKVVGCGVMLDAFNHWNDPLIKIAGKELDYLSVHEYTGSGSKDPDYLYNFIVGAPTRIEKLLKDTAEYINKLSPGRKIPLAFDEWNVWLPEANNESGLEMPYRLRDAIYAAGVFNAMHRLSDDVKMANLAQLVNVLGLIYTDQTRAIPTPLHAAFQLYNGHTGEEALKVNTESPTFNVTSVNNAPEYKAVPYIDCSATISRSKPKAGTCESRSGGLKLYLAVINRHPSEEIECEIMLKGFPPASSAGGRRALARQMNAESFTSREAKISEFTMSGLSSSFTQKFPPHSATIIEMEI